MSLHDIVQSGSRISFDYGLQVGTMMASEGIFKLVQSRPPSLCDHGLQVHFQTGFIKISECIAKFSRPQPPSVSQNTLDYCLQVHLQTHSVSRYRMNITNRSSSELIAWTTPESPGSRLSQCQQAVQTQIMLSSQSQITAEALRELVENIEWNGEVGIRQTTRGSQRRIWQKQKKCWSSIGRK